MPTAAEVARNLQRCLEDRELRKKLIQGGVRKTKDFYAGYDSSVEAVNSTLLERV